jgi:hypothetical protein
MDWLKENDVRIKENGLKKIHSVKVGILMKSIKKDEMVKFHEERLKKIFKKKVEEVPEFYLNIELLVHRKDIK